MERHAEGVRLWSIISWLGWADTKRRTVVGADNRNSKVLWYFPMVMASVLLYQKWSDKVGIATDGVPRNRAQ